MRKIFSKRILKLESNIQDYEEKINDTKKKYIDGRKSKCGLSSYRVDELYSRCTRYKLWIDRCLRELYKLYDNK